MDQFSMDFEHVKGQKIFHDFDSDFMLKIGSNRGVNRQKGEANSINLQRIFFVKLQTFSKVSGYATDRNLSISKICQCIVSRPLMEKNNFKWH